MTRPDVSTLPLMLTAVQAGEQLGVSDQTIYTLIASGDLDATNIGTGQRPKIRVPRDSIAEFIEKRTSNAKRLRTAS